MKLFFIPVQLFIVSFISLFLTSCHSNQPNQEDKLFQLLPSSQTHIDFNNSLKETKDMNVFNYRYFYNGAGVAIGDINNDGLSDIYFASNQNTNKLYLNKGNWQFEDITQKAGVAGIGKWHSGVTMSDVNGDGWLDIYVCNSGDEKGNGRANELYINQKNNTFKEEAHLYGLDDEGLTTHAAFFDYDHDGDLDCYVLNNSYRPVESFGYNKNLRTIRDKKGGHRLYRNDHNHFVDVSAQAGIYGSEIGFGLGLTVGDLNNDGWDDIYISNDFFEKDYLYINQKNGSFKEVIDDAMGHISLSSMGSDMTDINNDGYLDIFTTDMLPEGDYRLKTTTKFDDYDVYNAKLQNDFHHQFTTNCLQLNNGDGTFSEIAQLAGVEATDWSWGALSFDMNNDGWKDIFVCNGLSKDITDQDFLDYFGSEEILNQIKNGQVNYQQLLDKMPSNPIPNYAFINQQNFSFKNEAASLGLGKPSFSNGAAYGDLDNDGDLDLVINNANMPAFVYKNKAREQLHTHYLKIKLQGIAPNVFGIGTRVTLFSNQFTQVLQQQPTRGFESSMEPVLNFGLTAASIKIDSVVIVWPNLKQQTLYAPSYDTVLYVKQADANIPYIPRQPVLKPFFTNITHQAFMGNTRHAENNFIDFDVERLIPKMLSMEGPKLSVADVNGDGREDIFMGGASNDTAKLLIQQPGGEFLLKPQMAFAQDKDNEDIGSAFFDADNDGDLDLVVASGGNQLPEGSLHLLTRLYINDGKGNFTRAFQGWPLISINASCICTYDFDGDGNTDIFIGARSVPGKYGVLPKSVLLKNNGKGNFTNITASIAPDLLHIGMVTTAAWADIDNDNKKELIVAGDWMPVSILKYSNNKLSIIKTIPNSEGWWNCIITEDVNNDGKTDILAGNYGLNSKLKASIQQPAKLYVSDFDENGQTECIPVFYKTDGKPYPYFLRGDMVMQIPSLKKKFLHYSAYAGKTIDEIFSKEQLKKAMVLTVKQSQSCIFYNQGNTQFTTQPLPLRAQFAPVFGIACTDFNKDGIKDIFVAGNFYGLKPEVGRLDASYGVTLIGSVQGAFQYLPSLQSGLFIKGEVRDVKPVFINNKLCLAVAKNNDSLQLFKNVY